MAVVGIHRHRYLIEHVEQRHNLIPLVRSRIPQQYLQRRTHPIRLHLTEQTTLLALHAVQDVGDVVDVLLVLPHHRVARLEKFQRLLLGRTQVVPLQLHQQLPQQPLRLHVPREVVRSYREVVQVGSSLHHCLPQNLVDKQQIPYPLRMLQHPLPVLAVVEVELPLVVQVRPGIRFRIVFVEPAQMGGDAGVQPADDVVQNLLLVAHLREGRAEAVLLVDQAPNGGAVVVGEGLDVFVYVEVLAQVISLVLHVPHPLAPLRPLQRPQVALGQVRPDLLIVGPELRYVAFVAATDSTALTLADAVHDAQLALLVDVQPDYPEVLGLHQPLEDGSSTTVDQQQRVLHEPTASLHPHPHARHKQERQQQVPHPHDTLLLSFSNLA